MSDGYAKLADFDFSKSLISENKETSTLCGTLLYVAPEIFHQVPYSFTVDYWPLAVIEQKIINDEFECPNTVSSGLQAILKGLLIKDPEIEKRASKCPLKTPIRSNPLEVISSTQSPHLSHIDEQSQFATLTMDEDKFYDFSLSISE
ncbi:unnamed protein product [Rotaria socialis]|uniref:Protein kinase domain-containing protein n=2 Tax=Rotaria socialis TaxID=392032 RepID=A0A820EJ62_9BILA|nr:unnamed protein product [Rotaria socialis]CAF4247075.1 unnamed protein product [Rotaria socialis]CAF4535074.1 unnamed protein product [Rotaria socialis]